MSTGLRQRTTCQACGARCQSAPTEAMFHFGTRVNGYWLWSSKRLCPPCRAAQRDFWLAEALQSKAVSDSRASVAV